MIAPKVRGSPVMSDQTHGKSWIGPEGVQQSIAQADALVAPELQTLFAQWQNLRGARFAPSRDDLQPSDMTPLLRWSHLYDVMDGGKRFRVRVIGSTIVDHLKVDMQGQIIDDSNDTLLVRRVISALRLVIKTRQPIRTYTDRVASNRQVHEAAENLWLPLSSDGASVDKILGCTILRPAKA